MRRQTQRTNKRRRRSWSRRWSWTKSIAQLMEVEAAAAQTQRGHGEDNVDVLQAEAFDSPTLQCKVGCSRIFGEHVRPEVDKDRNSAGDDFDILIKQMWMQHMSALPENVAATKRMGKHKDNLVATTEAAIMSETELFYQSTEDLEDDDDGNGGTAEEE